jgi:hypothetical protein
VTTYGGSRLRTLLVGDPPRKAVTRVLRAQIGIWTPVTYLALYDLNRATRAGCESFLGRVEERMSAF